MNKDATLQGLRGILDGVYEWDADISVFQGSRIRFLTGLVHGVFDRHAVWYGLRNCSVF